MLDRDHESKDKENMYTDKRHNACKSDIKAGDKENKFSTKFQPDQFKAID